MRKSNAWFIATLVVCLIGVLAGAALAQTSTTKTQKFEVISVVGNQLVVRLPDGTKEFTVPEDFRFTVDGKQLSVHELKPGMAGEATTTTITTVKPVSVTEVRNAKIMQANGNSVVVRSADGKFKLFTQEDATKYKISIIRDGKPIEFQQMHAGDVVTATFVTQKDQVLTEQQVNASLAQAAPAAPAAKPAAAPAAPAPKPAASPAPAPAPPAAAPAPAPAPKTLPKTASELPLIGLLGLALLAIGAALTFVRRRRTT
jgi:LPXTG-motif cell wall-anchored protein